MNGQEPHGPPNRVVLGDVDLEINSSKVNIKEKTSSGKKLVNQIINRVGYKISCRIRDHREHPKRGGVFFSPL